MIISDFSKILIIRLSSIGDIVLTTGFIRNIKQNFPNSKIDFLTFRNFSQILKFNKNINDLILIDKKSSSVNLRIIKNKIINDYDLIIDLQYNSISKSLTNDFNGIKKHINKRRLFKLGLVWLKIGKNENFKFINDVYCDSTIETNLLLDNKGLEFWLEEDYNNNEYLPDSRAYQHKEKLDITIAPGAHYKTKRWNAENFKILLGMLNPIVNKVTVLGNSNDYKIGEIIADSNNQIINNCGKTDLLESAKMISESDLLITNDTGLMHIAAARKTPVAAIFGSTVREFGFVPHNVPNIIIETNLWCRPCSHIGRNFCPLGHFNCMNKITPENAYFQIIKFINSIYLKSNNKSKI